MASIFGTDGVRGQANVDLTPELALSLGRAIVLLLDDQGERRPSIVVGRDPRWSGEMLESALVAGITSAGGDAVSVGVLPTPGVAYLTARSSAAVGVMLSASHNPVGDNGIKVFGPAGFKLDDAEEARIEELVGIGAGRRPTGVRIGRRLTDPAAVARYIEHLTTVAATDLGGMRVVVDGANGAAWNVAPQVYRQLGAEVIAIHCSPDGANINEDCGSTHPEVIRAAVLEHGADLGVSHDGDADRLIAASHEGAEVDGDAILAILARQAHLEGALAGGTVVTTVMANLGFRRAMDGVGIAVHETPVGDRYVLEAMRELGHNLGGEQSGHIIDLDRATTGDGVLTAARLMGIVRSTGTPLAELSRVMQRAPQVLLNVGGVDRARLEGARPVWDEVERLGAELGDEGRILLRASGTEPVVRVMVEAVSEERAREVADRLAAVVARELAQGEGAGR